MSGSRLRIAVAGFGPFPGMPKNPSAEIVRALTKMRRFPSFGITLDTAILPTVYGEARALLDKLIAKQPDAIVLFGVAGRGKHIRVETLASNRASVLFPDQARFTPATRNLVSNGPAQLRVRGRAMQMRAAIRAAGSKAELSINAGSYLCNAMLYRALAETAERKPAPLTFFIHVPPLGVNTFTLKMLIRAGEAAVWAAASESTRTATVPRRDG